MSDLTPIIRNYRPEDFDNLIRLGDECEKTEQAYCGTFHQGLIESIGQPNHFPENNLFVAEKNGNILGYIDVMPELNIGRVVLSLIVHPEHCRKGLPKNLVERATDRARELGVNIVHVNIPQDNVMAKSLFSETGFNFVRLFFELRLDMTETHLPKPNKMALSCRQLRHGEEDKLLEIQNRSFADTWGYNPNTIEDIMYRISLPGWSPEDIIITSEADRLIGYCWTRSKSGEDKPISGDMGRIYMLGVDPDHRGKRVGKHVLMAGLSLLKSRGVRIVELTVDNANKAALALYKPVGFQVWTNNLWYEIVLK